MKKFLLMMAVAAVALLADNQLASARRGGCGGGGGGRRGHCGGGCMMGGCGMGGCGMGGCGMGGCGMGGCGMGGCGITMGGCTTCGGYAMGGGYAVGGCPGGVCSIGGAPTVAQADGTQATLVLNLPEDATLTIDGEQTVSTSAQRVFVTPPLEEGKEYEYNLEVQVVRDGKTQTSTARVTVRPGKVSEYSLTIPDASVAAQ
jgi:uncharacterized protein (TIGR03000 family)